jgi:hypothetical protein
MGGEAVALAARGLGRASAKEPVAPAAACDPGAVAAVLSRLLLRAVGVAEVRDRAVGLGLMRLPPPGGLAELTAEATCRLFLAGYRLPAAVGPGTPGALREHLAAGRHVFVLVGDSHPDAAALQVHGLLVGLDGSNRALVSRPAPGPPEFTEVALGRLAEGWAAAGQLMVVAARRWADLPASGATFFAGGRDRDGSFHWDAAECTTDSGGCILRC